MIFSGAVTTAVMALFQIAAALPITAPAIARADPHELDFRTYGVSGCSDENQGVYTLELSNSDECLLFVEPIGSLSVTDNLCTLTIYADAVCTESPVVVPTDVCQNGSWQSYKLSC